LCLKIKSTTITINTTSVALVIFSFNTISSLVTLPSQPQPTLQDQQHQEDLAPASTAEIISAALVLTRKKKEEIKEHKKEDERTSSELMSDEDEATMIGEGEE
jgi:hypothetical protein